MEYRKDISDAVCIKINCKYLGNRANGEQYCKAYFPECDEYEAYEDYLNIKPKYIELRNKLIKIKSDLKEKGIVISSFDIAKYTRED
jgi:hypothetical protein